MGRNKNQIPERFVKGEYVNYDPSDRDIIIHDEVETHKIIKCMGTIDSSKLEMELENIETKEHITIKL